MFPVRELISIKVKNEKATCTYDFDIQLLMYIPYGKTGHSGFVVFMDIDSLRETCPIHIVAI